jgi:hypothetical protein
MLTFMANHESILLRKVQMQSYHLVLKHRVLSHLGLDKPLII